MFFTYPTETDWASIEMNFDFNRLFIALEAMDGIKSQGNGIAAFTNSMEIHDWFYHLQGRIHHTQRSCIMTRFYFDLGIPDEEWWRSPGDNGESIQYFPDFCERNYWNKTQFDFYADTFYYNYFSSIDTIGQILNTYFALGVSDPTFSKVLRELKPKDVILYQKLQICISKTSDYNNARKFRNDITHNFSPGRPGNTICKKKLQDGRVLINHGVGTYVTSKTFMNNISACFDILCHTMETITQHINTA